MSSIYENIHNKQVKIGYICQECYELIDNKETVEQRSCKLCLGKEEDEMDLPDEDDFWIGL